MFRADIQKDFAGGVTIEAAFDLDVEAAAVAVLFGPSGSGKTTLLRCIAGLERPTRGRVTFGSESWCDVDRGQWTPPQRRQVGYLFQDYALFPHLSVARNVGYGIHELGKIARRDRVTEVARRLGLGGLLDRYPHELSGGQQQRVALARVLARRPRLLLLDEPFSALDLGTREEVRSYLSELLAEFRVPAIVVTHDWADALALGDSMIVLRDGRMLQSGSPQEVLTRPAATAVASIVGVETVEEGLRTRGGAGMVTLRVGSTELVAVDRGTNEDEFWVCIRGEDVTLETSPVASSSARNHLDGQVVEIIPKGPLTKVILDVGFPLVALVTRQSALDLELVAGKRVRSVFKASIVHLIPRR
jgi:molybdate transport system ATP-binding protein